MLTNALNYNYWYSAFNVKRKGSGNYALSRRPCDCSNFNIMQCSYQCFSVQFFPNNSASQYPPPPPRGRWRNRQELNQQNANEKCSRCRHLPSQHKGQLHTIINPQVMDICSELNQIYMYNFIFSNSISEICYDSIWATKIHI